jgi:pimeloyl-ACP methyl ester carboxylesterase
MDARTPADQVVELSRGRMHLVAAGDGPAIVMLHGWPGFWYDYRHVLRPAGRLGRCIAPDFFGFGESERILGDPADVADEEAFARDIVDLFDALKIDQALLVGHDIGSAVGPAVARLAPGRVQGLLLLNPTHPYVGDKRFRPEAQRESWYQWFHQLPLAEWLIDGDRERVRLYLSHFYEHWAGNVRTSPNELERIVDAYSSPGAFASSLQWYRARVRRRDRPDTPLPIGTPTIALWGDRDPMRPLDHRQGFQLAFTNSRDHVLSGVGHFVPAEAPDAVVAAIADLIAGRSPDQS